jgi:hypothetical protein
MESASPCLTAPSMSSTPSPVRNCSAWTLANPADANDLIIAGHAYGYSPATTIACIDDTHDGCC